MSVPVSYTTREPNTVQAMLFDGETSDLEDVRTWVRDLLDDLESVAIPNGMTTNLMFVYQGNEVLRVEPGYYVYWDGAKVSAIAKAIFELNYAPTV